MKDLTDTIIFSTCLLGLPLILSLFMYDNIDNIINSGFLIHSLLLLAIGTLAPLFLIGSELYDIYDINKRNKELNNK